MDLLIGAHKEMHKGSKMGVLKRALPSALLKGAVLKGAVMEKSWEARLATQMDAPKAAQREAWTGKLMACRTDLKKESQMVMRMTAQKEKDRGEYTG